MKLFIPLLVIIFHFLHGCDGGGRRPSFDQTFFGEWKSVNAFWSLPNSSLSFYACQDDSTSIYLNRDSSYSFRLTFRPRDSTYTDSIYSINQNGTFSLLNTYYTEGNFLDFTTGWYGTVTFNPEAASTWASTFHILGGELRFAYPEPSFLLNDSTAVRVLSFYREKLDFCY